MDERPVQHVFLPSPRVQNDQHQSTPTTMLRYKAGLQPGECRFLWHCTPKRGKAPQLIALQTGAEWCLNKCPAWSCRQTRLHPQGDPHVPSFQQFSAHQLSSFCTILWMNSYKCSQILKVNNKALSTPGTTSSTTAPGAQSPRLRAQKHRGRRKTDDRAPPNAATSRGFTLLSCRSVTPALKLSLSLMGL